MDGATQGSVFHSGTHSLKLSYLKILLQLLILFIRNLLDRVDARIAFVKLFKHAILLLHRPVQVLSQRNNELDFFVGWSDVAEGDIKIVNSNRNKLFLSYFTAVCCPKARRSFYSIQRALESSWRFRSSGCLPPPAFLPLPFWFSFRCSYNFSVRCRDYLSHRVTHVFHPSFYWFGSLVF